MFEEIKEASHRIKKYIKHIPLYFSDRLSEVYEGDIYLKLENLQKTGSFKIRGALNAMLKNKNKCSGGVVAASAGNHAQGVAYGAQLLDIPAYIVMPRDTPLVKIKNTELYGAEVILYGDSYDEAYSMASQMTKEKKLYFIHPFDNEDVICGQGTIGEEIFSENKKIDQIIVPVGGGGLISGIGSFVKEINPATKIVGVQAENVCSMFRVFKDFEVVGIPFSSTLAEGIAVKHPGEKTAEICKKVVDEMVTVSENDIARAVLDFIELSKLVVEGAAAVPLAAVYASLVDVKSKSSVLVISGGNIDVNLITRIINKGLISTGRFVELTISLRDRPGALAGITNVIAETGANILNIEHFRFDNTLPVGFTRVTFSLETKGLEHIRDVVEALRQQGYDVTVNSQIF